MEKNIQKELASHEQFHKIVEMNADGMIVVDKNGATRFVNPAAVSLLEHGSDELIETLFCYSIVPGKTIEVDIPRRSGEIVTAEIRVMEIEWEGDAAYLASIHDITEMKKNDRMKSEFISVASHELRTPLTSIKNAVDILLKKKAGEINDFQKKFLTMAEKNINRLIALVNDLLDISRIESRGIELDLSKQYINEIIENVINTMRPLADAKCINIEKNMPQNLSGITADAFRIEQVFINLIGNAVKFTHEKGTIVINVDNTGEMAENGKAFLEVSVTDNGIGIPEEQIETVFEKFSQVGSSLLTVDRSGTGLGLSICKGIVEAHGGSIRCISGEGEGSSFVFTLPVKNDSYHVIGRNKEKEKCKH